MYKSLINELYIHQRKADKKVFPLLFGMGAGGKVDEGETFTQAAQRELNEELGIETIVYQRFKNEYLSLI